MKYEAFIETVEAMVREKTKDQAQVRLTHICKNNDTKLQGICISSTQGNMAPIIYLHTYYEQYQQGENMDQIVDSIIELSAEHMSDKKVEVFFEFEQMKEKIFYRLVHFEKNQEMLTSTPHISYLDLAITFHCLVRHEEEEIGTIRITNEHLHYWNTTCEELLELASINTPSLFPSSVRTMGEVIAEIIPIKEEDCYQPVPMYVLTNTSGINGATVILYQDVLHQLSDILQSDLYILPSSIHEVIAVPAQNGIHMEDLGLMVMDINQSQVAPEEVLSNQVYRYQRCERAIGM